jgi:hypothetical protein
VLLKAVDLVDRLEQLVERDAEHLGGDGLAHNEVGRIGLDDRIGLGGAELDLAVVAAALADVELELHLDATIVLLPLIDFGHREVGVGARLPLGDTFAGARHGVGKRRNALEHFHHVLLL